MGIAIVPSVARKFKIAEVKFRPIKERFAIVDFAMAWRKSDSSPVVQAFVEMVTKMKELDSHSRQARAPFAR